MERSPKVATPLTAATLVLPESVPPAGLLPSATVTVPVKLGTALPSASCAATFTAGAIWWLAVAAPGWTVKARCVAGPGETLKSLLVPALSPAPRAGTEQPPLGPTRRVAKPATPLTDDTVR